MADASLASAVAAWRDRRARSAAVSAWRGASRIIGQDASGESRRVEPRDGADTAPGSPGVSHGTVMLDDFEAPWLARMMHDLLTLGRDPPLFVSRDGVLNSVTGCLADDTERLAFMMDLFYQKHFFQSKTVKNLEQAWQSFLSEYNKSPEKWHKKLIRDRTQYEAKTLVGHKMRIHRLCMAENIGCAVRRQFSCHPCSFKTMNWSSHLS
jgi:hypothetical protein